MSCNVSGPLRAGCSTGAWSLSSLLRRSVASGKAYSNVLLLKAEQGEVDLYAKVVGLDGRRGRIWYLCRHLGPFWMPCW
jgi:hypothetical protein